MAEPTKKPKKSQEPQSSSSVLINIFIGLALVGTVTVAALLANGYIKLDFLFKESGENISKKEDAKKDSTSTDDSSPIDYSIESTDSNSNSSGNSALGVAKSPDGKFHVIAGVYYNDMLRDRQRSKYRSMGLSTQLLKFTSDGGNVFYRLSVFSSDDLASAEAKVNDLKSSKGIDAWILKP